MPRAHRRRRRCHDARSRSAASPASRTPSWRVELGAWALGFILWPRLASAASTRPSRPGSRARVRRQVELVGVFVNPPLDEVARAADVVGLTHVQLHGDEGPAFCAEVAQRTGAKVIKARADRPRAPTCSDARALPHRLPPARRRRRRAARRHRAARGTGASPRERRSKIPLILLRRADARQRRRGDRRRAARARVDVASGVEAAPGIKDPAKLEAFLRRRAPAGAAVRPIAMSAPVEHRFGPYGGQYVPETLMPALAELEAAWLAARDDAGFRAELARAAARLRRPPDAAVPRRSGSPRRPGTRSTSSARTSTTRRAQDQQRARPGAARQAHGQDAHHRRDRRRPARRRHRDRVRAARPRVRRLHGHRGHAPPAAQRPAHGAAGRDASSRSTPARARSRRRSRPRSATGSPTSPTRTT